MSPTAWSWILACVGVVGIFIVGKKNFWGWVVLVTNECLWTTYALITEQHGFIFGAVVYTAVYIRNFLRWRKEHREGALA